ncbi:MAG: energy transducer TonB [Bacteroidota bacterium]
MNLNNKQLSLIITIFTMGIVVLMAYNVHLVNKEEDEYVIEMALLDEEVERLLEEKEQLEQLAQSDPVKSHRAFNETAKPSVGNPEPLKTLEELLEEREINSTPNEFLENDAGYAANLKELAKKRQERKEQLGEREADKKEFTENLKDKRTSISYSLVDRNAYYLPPPIYTCIEGGKVVINVTVDNDGYVREATFNEKSSGTNNYCLIDNAIAYALKARFSAASRSTQIGTITYLFQSK